MEKLIIRMEAYKKDNLTMSEKELKELQALTNEINILIKHSSEKITINKADFATYFNLLTTFKEIEGFNHAINYVESYNKEIKE
ncbi:MAG: hypothetical protein J6R47_05130 [Acholeplasmatales bacterium]|nr:hypothetical protein [Acholeplasmatales bacterium]